MEDLVDEDALEIAMDGEDFAVEQDQAAADIGCGEMGAERRPQFHADRTAGERWEQDSILAGPNTKNLGRRLTQMDADKTMIPESASICGPKN
jgi:hypothetical protein